ncbi:MAG: hypothetical protein AB7E81_20515 [Hyphomicrobiaceae bacterium]
MTLSEDITKVKPAPYLFNNGVEQMRDSFTTMPKAFREKDLYGLEPIEFADLLLDLEAELRFTGLGIAHYFQVALLGQRIWSCAVFALRKKSVILIKIVGTPTLQDVLEFDFAPIDFGVREFNRIPVPVTCYVPYSPFTSRMMARGERSPALSR